MRHVIERCPTCGVEHDEAVMGTCEACGDTLRPWCRRHGNEAGWLQGPVCPRCAEEAARPAPRPTRRPAAPPVVAAPVPATATAGAPKPPVRHAPRKAGGGRPASLPGPDGGQVRNGVLVAGTVGGLAGILAALALSGTAWAAILVFGYVGIAMGALFGWVRAVDAE